MIKRMNDIQKQPYHRPNDNWIDLPIQTLSEGGELTSITVRKRSLRAKRRIFTLSCTGFTIGLLMILCTSPYGNEFLAPGGLSSNHAQILAKNGPNRCSACHAAGNGSVVDWIANSLSGRNNVGLTQSELCMKCHDASLAAGSALHPHNVSPDRLANITDKYQQVGLELGQVFPPPVSGHNIACAACHREHHGSKHDLTAMTDIQCQACHQNSFHRFEIDHPEFVRYPSTRRSRIAFDHSSHSNRHFPAKQSAFNCNQCHLDDAFQNVKRLASFEQACSTCHDQQIFESGREGLALISLPMLDTKAIEDANLKIGTWPLAATGDFDGPLPPLMRVMLSADPQATEILVRRGPGFEFSDLDPAKASDVKDAVELAWAIKRLLYDLSLDGPRVVRRRLESVLELEVKDDELPRLIENLTELVFQNAVRRWLPNLNVEVAHHRFGQPEEAGNELEDIALKQAELSWWPADEKLLMRAAGEGELLAENPLAGLIRTKEGAVAGPMPVVRVPAKRRRTPAEAKRQESGDPSVVNKLAVRLKNMHADPLSDPYLLAVNPLVLADTPLTGAAPVKLPRIRIPLSPQTGFVDENNDVGDQIDKPSHFPGIKKHDRKHEEESKFVQLDGPRVVVPVGWIRDDSLFRISYLPSGHSDDCIKSWIELFTRAVDADSRPETKQLFEKTTSLMCIGSCRTCHTTDQLPDRSLSINWRAENRDPSVRTFTRFSHGPHLIQPNLQNCSHCHTLDPGKSNHEFFQGTDASLVVSNFLPITKSNCVSCHQTNQTGNRCTKCHSYHIGSKVSGSK